VVQERAGRWRGAASKRRRLCIALVSASSTIYGIVKFHGVLDSYYINSPAFAILVLTACATDLTLGANT
jgi:hypothetical protein